MEEKNKTNIYKRIIATSLTLIFLSAVLVVVIGISTKRINDEKLSTQMYLANKDNVQINFEKSLEIYTGETKEAVSKVLDLRPETESDLVRILSKMEDIGHKLKLNIELKSMEKMFQKKDDNTQKDSLTYSLSFYGTMNDMRNFLEELEQQLFYTQVEEIDFKETRFLDADQLEEKPNIRISIKLYTK